MSPSKYEPGERVEKGCVCHTLSLQIKERITKTGEVISKRQGSKVETGFGLQKATVKKFPLFLFSVAGGFPAL